MTDSSATIENLTRLVETGQAQEVEMESLRKHLAELEHGVLVSNLSEEVQQSIANLTHLSSQALNSITNHRILDSLYFPELHKRDGAVSKAYSNTFEWIFDESPSQKQEKALEGQTLFRNWVEIGEGMFHIIGKPGAGKSTLMRYIIENPQMKDLLTSWTAGKKLIIGKFFFWRRGGHMEHSIQAMLQTLLYDILKEYPELALAVFPLDWAYVHLLPWQAPFHLQINDKALRQAFERLICHPELGEKFCLYFHIDGLDEFKKDENSEIDSAGDEQYEELVHLILKWAKETTGGLKFCVSSRENIIFLQKFEGPKYFRLQDLTYDDMYRFVSDELGSRDGFIDLEKPVDGAERLFSKITERAEGVFLWVSLVVNGLVGDCEYGGASFSELECRVDDAPSDLQPMFKQIFKSIKKADRKRSEQTFTIVLKLMESTQWMRMSLFRFSLLDDFNADSKLAVDIDCLKKKGLVGMDSQQVKRRLDRARKQLHRLCKGLLEVRVDVEDHLNNVATSNHWMYPAPLRNKTYLVDFVTSIHRDVHEFLMSDEVRKERDVYLQGFDIDGAICQTFVAEIASMMAPADQGTGSWKSTTHVVFYIPELVNILESLSKHDSTEQQHLRALDNIDALRYSAETSSHFHEARWRNEIKLPTGNNVPCFGDSSFSVCNYAAACGFEKYFSNDFQLDGRDKAIEDGTFLFALMQMMRVRDPYRYPASKPKTSYASILQHIVQSGRPSKHALTMAWEHFIALSIEWSMPWTPNGDGAGIAMAFLKSGADPGLQLRIRSNKWESYLDARPSTQDAKFHRIETLPESPGVSFLRRKDFVTLRELFEFLNPPNLQTLLSIMDKGQGQGELLSRPRRD
jgi:hypothetical protein